LTPLFSPQIKQKYPQKIQKWSHRFSPQKIQKSPHKRLQIQKRFVNYEFFVVFLGLFFVLLGGLLYYSGKFCFIWGIIVIFEILFVFFGGKNGGAIFVIFGFFFVFFGGIFVFFWGKKSGGIFVFSGGIFVFSGLVFNMIHIKFYFINISDNVVYAKIENFS
jgi:hypothetical protein